MKLCTHSIGYVIGRVVASRYMSETTAAGVKSTATTTRPSTNTAASARTTVKPPTAKALRPTTTAVKPQPTTRPTSAQEHSIAPKRTIGKHSKELEILRSQYTQTAYLKHCAEKAFSALEMDVLEKLNVMTRECCELEDTVRQMESEFIESELEHRMAHHIDQQV